MLRNVEILLVEDNHSDAFLFQRALHQSKVEGDVFIVRDGEEALDYLYAQNEYASNRPLLPKVIFLDLKLPKINGLEVLENIKNDPRTRCITVVILTSSSEESDLRKAYALGVNSYLVKPVDMDTYSKTISQLTHYWLQMNRAPVTGE
ncbi:MAG: response regulator [Candidatus Cloacimonetes bacterium]|nr:response regulator [Candidatus Cloacimonadota bacterium]